MLSKSELSVQLVSSVAPLTHASDTFINITDSSLILYQSDSDMYETQKHLIILYIFYLLVMLERVYFCSC